RETLGQKCEEKDRGGRVRVFSKQTNPPYHLPHRAAQDDGEDQPRQMCIAGAWAQRVAVRCLENTRLGRRAGMRKSSRRWSSYSSCTVRACGVVPSCRAWQGCVCATRVRSGARWLAVGNAWVGCAMAKLLPT